MIKDKTLNEDVKTANACQNMVNLLRFFSFLKPIQPLIFET